MFGSSERILVLPVDHGMALGNVPGLDDPVALALDFLKVDGVNGILSSLPVARRLEEAGMSGEKLRIVTLDERVARNRRADLAGPRGQPTGCRRPGLRRWQGANGMGG